MSTRAEPAGKIRRHPGRVASGVQHYANRTKTFHVKRFGTIEAVNLTSPHTSRGLRSVRSRGKQNTGHDFEASRRAVGGPMGKS